MLDQNYYNTVKLQVAKVLEQKGKEYVSIMLNKFLEDLNNQLNNAILDRDNTKKLIAEGVKPIYGDRQGNHHYYRVDGLLKRQEERITSIQNTYETALSIMKELTE